MSVHFYSPRFFGVGVGGELAGRDLGLGPGLCICIQKICHSGHRPRSDRDGSIPYIVTP